MYDPTSLKNGDRSAFQSGEVALRLADSGLRAAHPFRDGLDIRERSLLDSVTHEPAEWPGGSQCVALERPRRGLFRVVDGVCLGYRLFPDGNRQVVSIYLPGDLIGPDCLVTETSRETVSPAAAARLAFTPLDALRECARTEPGIAAMLSRELVRRLAIYETWISLLGRRTALERMAFLFCEIFVRSRKTGSAAAADCAFPVTQQDLADALGLSLVHTNRVLRALRLENLAGLSGGRVHIRDWHRLARVAGFEDDYLF